MKKYSFELSDNFLKLFFPEKRIKSKIEIIELLLEATRFMLVKPSVSAVDVKGRMLLYIDKMSRIFFLKQNKYYSIVFPFNTYDEDDKFRFSFQNIDVDSQLISKVLSTIKCDQFTEKCSIDFVSPIYDYEEETNENFWIFLREILLMEDGYIRYDCDQKLYELAKKEGNEHKHPLHHYDLFYTNKASFKIGLRKLLSETEFIDFLNINTNCKYLIG